MDSRVPTPAPFEPDHLYCTRCHAQADGACAVCRAILCADCAVLTGGVVQLAAVCRPCAGQGRGQVGWRDWGSILLIVGAVLAGLLSVAYITAS